jgi:hypothetical protein
VTSSVPQDWHAVAETRERNCRSNWKIPQTSSVKTLKAAFQLCARQAPDTKNVACLAMVGSSYTILVAKLAESAGIPNMGFDLSIAAVQ